MSSPQPVPQLEHILQTGFAFWPAKTLLSAIEIGVFTELAKQPQKLDSLAGSLGLHARSSRDFLDTLVALGFLVRREGVYSNTPSTDFFLDRNKPSYVGGILEMGNHRLYGFWGHLTTALRTGQPQNEASQGGPDVFAQLYADPERLKGFLHAMTAMSRGANMAIARQFPWAKYKTTADVGTAQGDLVSQVALANSHIVGIGFDLPEVAPIFEGYVEGLGLSGRVRFQPGNFFQDAMPRADVIMMGHILHDWNLEEKKALIRKAWDAIPEGGALIAYDAVIDDDRSVNSFGLMMSLNMLIETPGGFDYTGGDCIGWMKEAGFREASVAHLAGPDSMVIGIK